MQKRKNSRNNVSDQKVCITVELCPPRYCTLIYPTTYNIKCELHWSVLSYSHGNGRANTRKPGIHSRLIVIIIKPSDSCPLSCFLRQSLPLKLPFLLSKGIRIDKVWTIQHVQIISQWHPSTPFSHAESCLLRKRRILSIHCKKYCVGNASDLPLRSTT